MLNLIAHNDPNWIALGLALGVVIGVAFVFALALALRGPGRSRK
jgi:hypothetical protein